MTVIWSGVTEEGAVVPVQVDETGKVIATAAVPGGDYVKKTGDNMTGNLTFDESLTLGIDGSINADGNITTDGRVTGSDAQFAAPGAVAGSKSAFLGGSTSSAFYVYDDNDGSKPIGIGWDGSITAKGTAQFGSTTGGVSYGVISNANSAANNTGAIYAKNGASGGRNFLGLKSDSAEATCEIFEDGSAAFDGEVTAAGKKCGFTLAGEIFFTSRGARYRLVVQGELVVAEPYTRAMELKEKAEQFIADKRETKPSDPQSGVSMDIDNSSPKQD